MFVSVTQSCYLTFFTPSNVLYPREPATAWSATVKLKGPSKAPLMKIKPRSLWPNHRKQYEHKTAVMIQRLWSSMSLYYCCSSQSIDRITWRTNSTAKELKVLTIPKGWAESPTSVLDHLNLIQWNKGISCDFLATLLLIHQIQHVPGSVDDASSLFFNFNFQNCLEYPGGDSKIIEKQVIKSILHLELSQQRLYLCSV